MTDKTSAYDVAMDLVELVRQSRTIDGSRVAALAEAANAAAVLALADAVRDAVPILANAIRNAK